jgi:hypothetical protein
VLKLEENDLRRPSKTEDVSEQVRDLNSVRRDGEINLTKGTG